MASLIFNPYNTLDTFIVMADKKKILFFHFDLKGGGAERVLINLLKHLDLSKYDVTLKTIFGAGPHVKNVPKGIKFSYFFRYEFRGFNKIMKLFPAKFWHRLFIREHYDVEVAYLENSPTRIVAACGDTSTKKIGWVHIEFKQRETPISGFRNEEEMISAYNKLDELVFVAQRTKECFESLFPEIHAPMQVIHNVQDFDEIHRLSKESISLNIDRDVLNICAVNRLIPVKGFHRFISAFARLKSENLTNGLQVFILGEGAEKERLLHSIDKEGLSDVIHLLGFDPNPYRYLSKMDLFVCTSYREGYSTAVTESVALGVPVFTTDCSGMDEILEGGKYGMIVPNDDESIYEGLKDLLTHREKIKQYAQAISEAPRMTTQSLVDEYEKFFDSL